MVMRHFRPTLTELFEVEAKYNSTITVYGYSRLLTYYSKPQVGRS